MLSAGRITGAMALGFSEQRDFDEDDRTFIHALAHQAAQTLERSRLYNAEREARAEAERANRVKADFLAMMSHDLRTPLNAIGGYAELLEMGVHGTLNETQAQTVQRIQRSERRLRSLIEDVLSFARIEAGRLDLAPRAVRIRELLVDVETATLPQLHAKELRYSCEGCD